MAIPVFISEASTQGREVENSVLHGLEQLVSEKFISPSLGVLLPEYKLHSLTLPISIVRREGNHYAQMTRVPA